ncbi:MAG: gliding motility-associated C-terminal domain-containing protein [Candidatus Latescibacteria bacterium]|nr:gliding motility-associated C-terminal domain-containing protein [Candidatus Latescibacterota bacterium]
MSKLQMLKTITCSIIWCLLILCKPALAVDRYVINMKDAVTSGDEKIRWKFPGGGVVRLTDNGWVTVDSVRHEENAALDAHAFTYQGHVGEVTGGIRSAGTNSADAPNVIDGNPFTFWSPPPDAPVESWWIEIDLGRVVTAKKIRLIFDKDRPPFSEFKVFVSTGELRFPGTALKTLLYEHVAQTVKPNTEYVFEHTFDSERDEAGHPLSGKYVHYVKVFFSGKEKTAGLAELEVITLGQNIALRTIDRGGLITNGMALQANKLFDGVLWSPWHITNLGDDWLQSEVNGPWFNWDLGTQFWVNKIKLITRGELSPQGNNPMDGFKLFASDGSEAIIDKGTVWKTKEGKNLQWEQIADINNKAARLNDFEINVDPPRRIHHLFFHHFYGQGIWRSGYQFGAYIYEWQIFGKGFLPGVTLLSPLINLGQSRNITAISWEDETPPGTRIQIRTRTGERTQKILRWFNSEGKQIIERDWTRLPTSRRGPKDTVEVADEQFFSPWSPPYDRPGAAFASPSPRQYLLFEIELISDDPNVAPSLGPITLFHAPPVAASLYGVLEPREAKPGIPERFRFSIRPIFASGNTGFDRIALLTPSKAEDVSVTVKNRTVIPTLKVADDSLLVVLPEIVRRDTVEVGFQSVVFLNSTILEASVADKSEAWQRVDPELSLHNATTVTLPILEQSEALMSNISIEPQVMTPNGDGINDVLHLQFTVLKVQAAQRIHVEVYTLGGTLINRFYNAIGQSGNYEAVWDGRDQHGRLVAPGLYTCLIRVEGDTGDAVIDHQIVVVY